MPNNTSIITFSPSTTIKSADVNLNFSNLNAAGIMQLLTGSIKRIAFQGGIGTYTVGHGFGEVPDVAFGCYMGNFGGPPTNGIYAQTLTTSSVTMVGQTGFYYMSVIIKFT